eukprot:877919-Pelagomonas_calceolata.AAC.1
MSLRLLPHLQVLAQAMGYPKGWVPGCSRVADQCLQVGKRSSPRSCHLREEGELGCVCMRVLQSSLR